jgi:hypothetical protein
MQAQSAARRRALARRGLLLVARTPRGAGSSSGNSFIFSFSICVLHFLLFFNTFYSQKENL